MKKWLIIVLALPLAFFSCDIIDAPYVQTGPNGCSVTTPSFTPRSNPVKKVLIEEFTGHRCGNCPKAASEISNIIAAKGNQVVAIAYHSALSGYFTSPLPNGTMYSADYRTELSKELDQKYGISAAGLPNGMVNRRLVDGSSIVSLTKWSNTVNNFLAENQLIDIQLKVFYDPSDSSLCAFAYVQALEIIDNDLRLVMVLTESNVLGWQKDYTLAQEDIENYTHKHMLRAGITTVWGKALNNGKEVSAGQEFIEGYSIPLNLNSWNPANLSVVAYVYDYTTNEVLQAEEVKIMN